VSCKDRLDAALCLAASNGHEETAQILVDSGATIDCRQHGTCPFEVAAHNSQIYFLRFLVKQGVDLTHQSYGSIFAENALEGAARNG